MAAVELEFAINVTTGLLSASYQAMQPFTLPHFIAGSTVNFRVRLVKSNPHGGFGALSVIPLDGLSLKVSIGAADNALTNVDLAVQNDALVGALPLNVAAITGLWTGDKTLTIQKIIEFRVNDSGFYQPIQKQCYLIYSVASAATVPAQAPEEALGKKEAAQAYVPRDGGDVPGQGFIMTNPLGEKFAIYMGNDRELHWELIV
jgi:hypothetical protein